MSPYLDFWAHQPCGGGPSTMAMIYKIQLPLWWSSRSVIFVNLQAVFNSSSNCLQSLKECSKSIRSLKYLVLLSCSDDLYCFTCVRCECALCSGLAPCTSGSTPVLNHYQARTFFQTAWLIVTIVYKWCSKKSRVVTIPIYQYSNLRFCIYLLAIFKFAVIGKIKKAWKNVKAKKILFFSLDIGSGQVWQGRGAGWAGARGWAWCTAASVMLHSTF